MYLSYIERSDEDHDDDAKAGRTAVASSPNYPEAYPEALIDSRPRPWHRFINLSKRLQKPGTGSAAGHP